MKNQNQFFAGLVTFVFWTSLLLDAAPGMAQNPSQQDWQLSQNFYNYLWKGDFTNVFERIKQDPKIVNQPLWTRDTPILLASESGHPDVVELLLTNHADINVRGRFGETALHYAVNKGDAKTAEVLLNYHADINTQDDNHIPPICYAFKNVEVLKVLLAHGADINANGLMNSLLSMVLGNYQSTGPGVIEYIVTNGLDVSKCDQGPIIDVLFRNDTNLMKLLLPLYVNTTKPKVFWNANAVLAESMDRNMQGMTKIILEIYFQNLTNRLQKAVLANDTVGVRSLLATNPAAVNLKDFYGWSPLHLAAIKGNSPLAELLIAHQANVDDQDYISDTPLHWAAFFGHEDLVVLLLRHQADLNAHGNIYDPVNPYEHAAVPLQFAIRNGYTSIATMLITNGADLTPQSFMNTTALHLATENENVELISLLLAHGAPINAMYGANFRQTPLDIAVCGKSPEAVELLISHHASLNTQMTTHNGKKMTLFHLWADRGGNTNIAENLLSAGCDLNATNGEGQTPLHVAVGRWTCSFSPDPATLNQTNSKIHIPIKWIMKDSGGEPALWLLNHQADVNARDTNGQTALHLIVKTANTNAIQVLLNHKADINARDKNGKTPLAVMEDYKINRANDRHGFPMPDFKPAEALLQTNGATGAILMPPRHSGPINVF